MKVRHLKYRQSYMSYLALEHRAASAQFLPTSLPTFLTLVPSCAKNPKPDPKIEELLTSMGLNPAPASAPVIEPAPVEHEVKTYTVVRKKDGVLVAEYRTLEEAEVAIATAKRQKKAALELLSSVMASI